MSRLFREFPWIKLISRFELAVICTLVLTGLMLSHKTGLVSEYATVVAAGYLLFAGTEVWCESRNYSKLRYFLVSVPLAIILAYVVLNTHKSGHIFLMVSLLSGAVGAPFWFRKSKESHVWTFQFGVLRAGVIAGFASTVLMLGCIPVVAAMKYLLNVRMYTYFDVDLAIIIWGALFPLMILNGIPSRFDRESNVSDHRWFQNLLAYIFVPILLVYAVILHIYGVQIFVAQVLPKGLCAYLVGVFSILCIAVYILSAPWCQVNQLIRQFRRWSGIAMLLPLALMAWGVYERISVYGVTSMRYVLVMLWFVLLCCSVLMILQTTQLSKRFFGIVAILSLLMVDGPLSIRTFPIERQLSEVERIIVSMQQHPELKKDSQLIDKLGQALFYTYQQDAKFSQRRLADILPEASSVDLKEPKSVVKYFLGVKLSDKTRRGGVYVDRNTYEKEHSFFVSGFKFMVDVELRQKHRSKTTIKLSDGRVLNLEMKEEALEVRFEGEFTQDIKWNLSDHFAKLSEKSKEEAKKAGLQFESENLRVYIRNLAFDEKAGEFKLVRVKLFLLIK